MKLFLLYLLLLGGRPFSSFVLSMITLSVVRSAQIPMRQRWSIAGAYAGVSCAVVFVDVATVFFRSAPDTVFQLLVNSLRVVLVFSFAKQYLRLRWGDVLLSVLILGVLDSTWVTSYWMEAAGKLLAGK